MGSASGNVRQEKRDKRLETEEARGTGDNLTLTDLYRLRARVSGALHAAETAAEGLAQLQAELKALEDAVQRAQRDPKARSVKK